MLMCIPISFISFEFSMLVLVEVIATCNSVCSEHLNQCVIHMYNSVDCHFLVRRFQEAQMPSRYYCSCGGYLLPENGKHKTSQLLVFFSFFSSSPLAFQFFLDNWIKLIYIICAGMI